MQCAVRIASQILPLIFLYLSLHTVDGASRQTTFTTTGPVTTGPDWEAVANVEVVNTVCLVSKTMAVFNVGRVERCEISVFLHPFLSLG